MKLNPSKVPDGCRYLIPLAEEWDIGDDFEREEKLAKATLEELQTLVNAIQELSDDRMYDWLGGPESYLATPSPEYLAFSCLALAYDSARVKLEKRKGPEPSG